MIRVGIAGGILGLAAAAIGLAWFGRKWLFHAALFFIPFVLLYSTFLTAPNGVIGGLVGALNYWTNQQDVGRGGQPLYYYAFFLVPMYEFLPALGTFVAAGIAIKKKLWQSQAGRPFISARAVTETEPTTHVRSRWQPCWSSGRPAAWPFSPMPARRCPG